MKNLGKKLLAMMCALAMVVQVFTGISLDAQAENTSLMSQATVSSTTVLQGNLTALTDGTKTWDTAGDSSAPAVNFGVTVDYSADNGMAYYQADFDETVSLGQVRLYLYVAAANERPQDIAVDVKLANGVWKRVAERHDIEYANGTWSIETITTGGAIAVYLGMNFETIDCVGFRVSANGQRTADENGSKGNFRVVEMEAYSSTTATATGTTKDSNDSYNIPYIVSEIDLEQNATLSSTTVLQNNLTYLTNDTRSWWNGSGDSTYNVEIGVAVDYSNGIAYYQADFDQELPLGQVRLYFYCAVASERPLDIAVDVKLADGTWSRVAERHDINYAEKGGDMSLEWVVSSCNAYYLAMNFDSIDCVGFRVSANGQRTADENSGNKGNFRLVELKAYTAYPSSQSVTGTTQDANDNYNIPHIYEGVDLMSYATLSSTSLLAGSSLSALTDNHKVWWSGDTTNYPYTAGAVADYTADNGMAYYQADFSEEVPLGQVRLYFRSDTTNEHPQDVAVDVKLADGTWERVAEKHDISQSPSPSGDLTAQGLSDLASACYLAMNFETIDCVGFRVSANGQRTADENGNKGNFRVVEMEAYSSTTATATGITKDSNASYNIPLLDLFNGMTIQAVATNSVAMKYSWTSLKDATEGDVSVVFELNGNTTEGVISEDGLSVTFSGVRAQNMADTITATFTVGNDTRVYEYSVAEYCRTILDNPNMPDAVKHLIVELIQYGIQVQAYRGETDTLSSLLTENDLAYDTDSSSETDLTAATQVDSKLTTDSTVTVDDADPIWKSVTLALKDQLNFRCKFNATSVRGLYVKIYLGDNTTETWTLTEDDFSSAGNGVYYFDFDEIDLNQFGTTFKFRFYNSMGVQIGQTLNYSVNTYINTMKDYTSVNALLTSIYALGKSAEAM